ncbi:hypothetical protein Tco_0024612 [Tanacetum coccineum]
MNIRNKYAFNAYISDIVVLALTSKPIDTPSVIFHFEFTSRSDASASSTAEGDLGKSYPKESLPQQQGNEEGPIPHQLISELPIFSDDEEIKMDDLIKLMPKPTEGILSQWDPPIDDQPIDVSDDDEVEIYMDTNDTIPMSPLASSKTLHV